MTNSLNILNREAWLETLLQNIGKAVIATDSEGNVTYMNEVAEQLIGRSSKDATGFPLKEMLHLNDETTGNFVTLPLDRVLSHHEQYSVDHGLLVVTGNGEVRRVTFTATPIRETEHLAKGAVIVLCSYEVGTETIKEATLEQLRQVKDSVRPCSDFFFVKRDGVLNKVEAADLLWVEAMENYAALVTAKDRFVVHSTLKKLALRLGGLGFQRVHRSYLVPLGKIDTIEDNRLYINGEAIPVGKSYRNRLMRQLHIF